MITPEPHELVEVVRELHQFRSPWLPVGHGSRTSWGPPVEACSLAVSCRKLDRILEHNPGDFTISVEAGTPLMAVQEALSHHRQWLAVDMPWGSQPTGVAAGSVTAAGSVGGLVARGLAGGYRERYLGIRDQLIGIGLLRADGVSARAGGKVVKNVAGYDLMRLFTGSWGSLGLITRLTLRTLPLPPERRGLVLQGDLPNLESICRWLLRSSLSPERIDWWSGPLAAAAGLAEQPLLLIGLASISPITLDEQIACLRERAGAATATSLDEDGLSSLQMAGQGAAGAEVTGPSEGEPVQPDWLLRLAVPPDQASTLLGAACWRGLPLSLAAGSGLGMAWGGARAMPAYRVMEARRLCHTLGGYLTVLRQPPATVTGGLLPAWEDAPSRALIEAVKRSFDPRRQLARGRLPGVQTPGNREG